MSVRSTGCPGTGRRNLARRGGAAIAATALAVVLVGCGSDDDGGEATATSTPPAAGAATTTDAATSAPGTSPTRGYGWTATPTSPAGATQAAGQATVTIDNFTFEPANPTFRVGQTVTVVNNDNVAHTWTSTEGGFDTGPLQPGESGTVTLDKAGTFAFFCTPHKATMTGTVTVQG